MSSPLQKQHKGQKIWLQLRHLTATAQEKKKTNKQHQPSPVVCASLAFFLLQKTGRSESSMYLALLYNTSNSFTYNIYDP